MDIRLYDVCVGNSCNYRCRYCYAQDYFDILDKENKVRFMPMSMDTVKRYIEYLKYQRKLYPVSDYEFSIQLFGGEPLLYPDQIEEIVRHAVPNANYNVVTNGHILPTMTDWFLKMVDIAKSRDASFSATVSYDYAIQNESRCPNSYETVRYAIKWLLSQNKLKKTIATFDTLGLAHIGEVFDDFISLRKETCDRLDCKYNLSLYQNLDKFDKDATVKGLESIRDYLSTHPEDKGCFEHNSLGMTNHWSLEECLVTKVKSCIDADGTMFPEYSTLYQGEGLRKHLKYGTVFDDFDTLESNQRKIIKDLNCIMPEQCNGCKATCKVGIYTQYIEPGWRYASTVGVGCDIRRLLHSYLGPYRVVPC